MTNEQLIAKLTEYAEWCDANEWEIPIDMGGSTARSRAGT